MAIVWIVVLTLLAVIIGLVAALLFVPLNYRLLFAYCESLQGTLHFNSGRLYTCRIEIFEDPPLLHVHILGLHLKFKLGGRAAPAPETPAQPETPREKVSTASRSEAPPSQPAPHRLTIKERISDTLDIAHFMTDTRLFREVWSFIKDSVKIINPDRIAVSGRFGFGNPAHTGYLLMLTMPLANHRHRMQFDIEPVWDQEVLEFKVDCRGRMSVYRFIRRGLQFAFNKKIRSKMEEFRELQKRREARKNGEKDAKQPG